MTLSEKAKTFYELGKEWMEMKVGDTRNEEKWVRLSVAQQEIDKLKTFRDNAYKQWCESEDKIKVLLEERDLLKQKLQEMAVATSLEHTHPSPEFWKGWNKAIDRVLSVLGVDGKEKAKPT
jgi:hypothetical protein